jgi:hypothetical protein
MFNIKSIVMKKFRMMLPVLAVVFAVVSAFGGSLLPSFTHGYYKIGVNCSQTSQLLNQSNCQTGLQSTRPICTVDVAGSPAAYADAGCSDILRQAQ